MKKNKSKNRQRPQPGPITDGDARPDQLDPDKIERKLQRESEENPEPFSSNRGADVNSLEDFKDEK
ncbi:MAG TPA: hypothetical protein VEB86_00045 [Chryseosolibacter sp.]|nr:hypothetical protein [Chryseosolibacter sp.]